MLKKKRNMMIDYITLKVASFFIHRVRKSNYSWTIYEWWFLLGTTS